MTFTHIRKYLVIISFCILSAGLGYRLGEHKTSLSLSPEKRIIINSQAPASVNVDFSLFWDVWQRLNRSYIDRASLDTQKMAWGAIEGMVNSLGDPYTLFLPPKENKDFKEDLGGQFEGIGAQLGMKDGRIMVIAPLKDNPAEKAGVLAGDYILKVNDEDTTGWTVPEAVTKIRGPQGTKVTLSILHEAASKPVDIDIIRSPIIVASVDSWIKKVSQIKEISGVSEYSTLLSKSGSLAYIRLSRFGDHSNDEWDKAVDTIAAAAKADSSIKGLIFDLRNNPGGYLDGSVFIGSEFIKSGIVVSQVNSDGSKQDYQVMKKGKLLDIPLVVLINKGSASAAEIVAGALRDYKRATLIGETSFGKGSVQTPEDLPGGAGLHITTGKWLLPKGDSIHKKGVTPDILVPMDVFDASSDGQLEKAVEFLLK